MGFGVFHHSGKNFSWDSALAALSETTSLSYNFSFLPAHTQTNKFQHSCFPDKPLVVKKVKSTTWKSPLFSSHFFMGITLSFSSFQLLATARATLLAETLTLASSLSKDTCIELGDLAAIVSNCIGGCSSGQDCFLQFSNALGQFLDLGG